MSLRSRWSVTARYALLPAASVLLVTLLMLALARWLAVDEMSRRVMLRNEYRAAVLAGTIDDALRGSVREVRLLARSPLMTGAVAPQRVRAELEQLQAQSPVYVWLGLVGMDGTVIAGTRGWLEGQSIANRPVFLQSRSTTWLGDVHPPVALAPLMKASGRPAEELIDIGEPVRDADGKVVGVMAAHLGVGWIDRLRMSASGESEGRAVPSFQMRLVSGPGSRSVLPGGGPPDGLPSDLSTSREVRALDGRRYLAASRDLRIGTEVSPLPWRVLVLQERDAAMAPAMALMSTMALVGGLAAVAVALVGALWARRVLLPWSPVFEAVMARTRGSRDELTSREGIDALMHELSPDPSRRSAPEALLARLAQDVRALRRVVDHLPVGVAMIDRNLRVDYVNPAYTRLLGWTTEQVQGRVSGEFLLDPVARADHLRMIEHLSMAPGEVAQRFDALTSDGQRVAVQWDFVPLSDPQGRLDGALVVVQDMRAERIALARADALAGRLRALADAALDNLLATLDIDGRVLEWSRGAERLSGQLAAEVMGRPVDGILQAGAAWQPWLLDARRQGACPIQAELMTGDGRLRWFEGSLYALGLASGSTRLGLILRDVTAQREVHQALEASESSLRLAIDAAQIGTWEIDLSGPAPRPTWSAGYGGAFGLPDDQLPRTAEDTYALMDADDRDTMRSAFSAMLRHDEPLQAEFRVVTDTGTHWHAVRGRALRGPDGRAIRLVGVGMDVTARRSAEAELDRSRRRLEHIIETMAEGLMITDAGGRYTLVNAAAARICGVDAAQVIGRRPEHAPWQRRRLADGVAVDQPIADLLASDHGLRNVEWLIERTDGTQRAISLNANVLLDARGQVDGTVATFVDITERHLAQVALDDSRSRLAAVVASASDAIISTDVAGRVALFNPAAERIFGVDAATMAGATLDRLLPGSMRGHHGAHMATFARSGTTRRDMGAGRIRGMHADGRVLDLEASISQAEVQGQTVLTAILRDVTERVAQERALEATRGELLQLTRRLLEQEKQTTRRLAQALHDELGQTLTALRLHWDALREAPADRSEAIAGRVSQLVATAHRQIRSVLDDLRPALLDEFGLAAALDNEMQQHRPVDGVPDLKLVAAPRLQVQRWPTQVEYAAFMVAREALLNALHHARARQITLTVDGDEGELLMTVSDDGIGVPPASQAGRAGHLGLVGMRERALAIGATLGLDSEPGRGTIIKLTWTMDDESALPDR